MRISVPYNNETTWTAILESCEENKGKIIWKRENQIYGKVRKFTGGGDFSIEVIEANPNIIVSVNYLSEDFKSFFDSLQKRLPNCTNITEKFQKEYCVICKKKLGFLKKDQWLTWHFGEGMLCINCYITHEKEEERKKKFESSQDPELLCTICKKKLGGFSDFTFGSFCQPCFIEKFGPIILSASNGQYHGGHKAFIAGGYGTKYELGHMYLTERYFIFIKKNDNPTKKIEIVIPLDSIQVEGWDVEEESRRKTVGIGGLAAPTGFGAAGISGGTIHDEGKSHHIIIPYIDENNISQKPRFGISSIGGKAIREWSEKIYQQIVKTKNTTNSIQEQIKHKELTNKSDDPLHVLKLRFAKGEITKKEYEEMYKILEG